LSSASSGKATNRKRGRLRSALRIAGVLLAVGVALAVLGSWSIEWFCIARPPATASRPAIMDSPVTEEGQVRRIGRSWIAREDGLLRMTLAGDPFTMGYSNGKLTQEYTREQEDELLQLVHRHVPSAAKLWLLRKYVLLRLRRLPTYILPEQREEIYGFSEGTPDWHPEVAPAYHRFLSYHAAHDISHAVMDHPLVGCTSFAARGVCTANGHLIVGRNFDFDAGRGFDTNKIVIRFKPDHGLSFISVAWPGMIGVVSGINEKRIAVCVNAAQSSDVRQVGTPVSLVLREVLQTASTLEEAVAIIRRKEVFVSDLYLVADGKTGEAVVVEKTPARCAVRRPTGDYLICANHFLTPELAADPANLRYLRDGTSEARFREMETLIKAQEGLLTPRAAVDILRNTTAGNGNGGLGNADAINALVATHSVVMDVTDGIIWVSAGPHQLGRFIPFASGADELPSTAEKFPADPLLADGVYQRYLQSLEQLSAAEEFLSKGRAAEAAGAAAEAARLNPGSYRPLLLSGKIALARKDWAAAQTALRDALAAGPPYRSERTQIESLLNEVAAHEAWSQK